MNELHNAFLIELEIKLNIHADHSWVNYSVVLGPSLLFASRAELFSEKASWAELSFLLSKPSQTELLIFQNWAIFYYFQLNFLKDTTFLIKNALLLMSSGLYLKKLSKLLKISSFFVYQGNSIFQMIEQAEPSFL